MSSSSAVQNQLETRRILAFIILVGAIFLLYIIRLVGLQILSGREWMSKAEENRLQEISLAPERGVIFDRNGTVLARNVPSYNVIVTAAFLPDDVGAIQNIIRDLSEYIEVPVNQGEISPENPFVPCRSEHGITQVVGYGQQSAPFREVKNCLQYR